MQELNLAYKYPIIYWNCASVCVDAGTYETEAEFNDDEEKEDFVINNIDSGSFDEDEDEEEIVNKTTTVKKKTKTTDYAKIASALNNIIVRGTQVVPPDINKSGFSFKPNEKDNQIIYGFIGIEKIGDALIKDIIKNRPYKNIQDFCNKIKCNRTQMINLIKAGVFDNLSALPKRELLYNYIASFSDLKSNLTLANVPMLLEKKLLQNKNMDKEIELFYFNKQLKKKQSTKNEDKSILVLDQDDCNYIKSCSSVEINTKDNNILYVTEKEWHKYYLKEMQVIKQYIANNMNQLLQSVNNDVVRENLRKYAEGTESEWEMKSISFYYSGHELSNIKNYLYNIQDFCDLPEEPEAEFFTQWKGQPYPIFKLSTIAGTVIGKNKLRHTIALLTTKEVVNVKLYADLFNYLDKQISVKLSNGKRKVMEKSWFARGNKLVITGIRRGDQFIPKVYKNTPIKQIYLVQKVNKDGTLVLQDSRFDPENFDEKTLS